MSDMTKTELDEAVKRRVDNNDKETAKSFVMAFGPQIKNYDVKKKLKEIDKINKKTKKEE